MNKMNTGALLEKSWELLQSADFGMVLLITKKYKTRKKRNSLARII